MRILGIDTSLRSSGYAVIEEKAGRLVSLDHGIIRNAPALPHSACLREIQDALHRLLAAWKPDVAAIEGGFFFKNARTALILGEARGVVIATCAAANLEIYEYSPRSVKQALTGFGAAQKEQVAHMVMRILGLDGKPPREDETDALGIAICHAQSRGGVAELRAQPI